MFTTEIDGKEVELKAEDLKPKEDGYAIITPDNVPDGYFTEDTVNTIVKENVNKTKTKLKDDLKEDEDFQKSILNKHNIVLDEEGNPKGLKPTEDIDEVRKKVAEEVSSDYENKLEDYKQKLSKRDQAVVESAIMSVVSGNYEDYLTKSYDGEKPLAVQKFADRIGVDEEGNPYVKNEDGEKMYKGDGLVSVKEYLLSEKFEDFMKDKRQKGSDFEEGGKGTPSGGDPSQWSIKKKNKYIDKHGRDGWKKLLNKNKKKKKD